MVRVTTSLIYVYAQPDFKSARIGRLRRDTVLHVEPHLSLTGPVHNPRWYRLPTGYVHSAYLQRVRRYHNSPVYWFPEEGQLGRITVPYTRSYRNTRTYGWVKQYRLYYDSVHWITDVDQGPDGEYWYVLTDELLHVQLYVPAAHVYPVPPEALKPVSPEVPLQEKRIQVSIAEQRLTAYEGDQLVLDTPVSTGIPNMPTSNGVPSATPSGRFRVSVKMPSKHMGDGELTDDPEAYELLGVPWVSFFHSTGVAFHGTYWHDNFGRMMSHGCVNMRNRDALWLYRWTHPSAGPWDWNRKGNGTKVDVI